MPLFSFLFFSLTPKFAASSSSYTVFLSDFTDIERMKNVLALKESLLDIVVVAVLQPSLMFRRKIDQPLPSHILDQLNLAFRRESGHLLT